MRHPSASLGSRFRVRPGGRSSSTVPNDGSRWTLRLSLRALRIHGGGERIDSRRPRSFRGLGAKRGRGRFGSVAERKEPDDREADRSHDRNRSLVLPVEPAHDQGRQETSTDRAHDRQEGPKCHVDLLPPQWHGSRSGGTSAPTGFDPHLDPADRDSRPYGSLSARAVHAARCAMVRARTPPSIPQHAAVRWCCGPPAACKPASPDRETRKRDDLGIVWKKAGCFAARHTIAAGRPSIKSTRVAVSIYLINHFACNSCAGDGIFVCRGRGVPHPAPAGVRSHRVKPLRAHRG